MSATNQNKNTNDKPSTMTYKEYKNTKEGELYEVLDGKVLNMASPAFDHQDISAQLHAEFVMYLRGKKCKAVAAPIDVFLFEDTRKWDDDKVKNWVIPDLVVVCDPDKIQKKGIVGVPDLIVEITSPSTAQADYLIKRRTYQAAGVKEYWIIDPVNQKVDVYILEDGKYNQSDMYFAGGSIKVNVLDDLTIDLKNIFPTKKEDE